MREERSKKTAFGDAEMIAGSSEYGIEERKVLFLYIVLSTLSKQLFVRCTHSTSRGKVQTDLQYNASLGKVMAVYGYDLWRLTA